MPRAPHPKFYAVRVGRRTGIFSTWDECLPLVFRFPGCKYKSFQNLLEAEAWMLEEEDRPLSLLGKTTSTSTRKKSKKKKKKPKKSKKKLAEGAEQVEAGLDPEALQWLGPASGQHGIARESVAGAAGVNLGTDVNADPGFNVSAAASWARPDAAGAHLQDPNAIARGHGLSGSAREQNKGVNGQGLGTESQWAGVGQPGPGAATFSGMPHSEVQWAVPGTFPAGPAAVPGQAWTSQGSRQPAAPLSMPAGAPGGGGAPGDPWMSSARPQPGAVHPGNDSVASLLQFCYREAPAAHGVHAQGQLWDAHPPFSMAQGQQEGHSSGLGGHCRVQDGSQSGPTGYGSSFQAYPGTAPGEPFRTEGWSHAGHAPQLPLGEARLSHATTEQSEPQSQSGGHLREAGATLLHLVSGSSAPHSANTRPVELHPVGPPGTVPLAPGHTGSYSNTHQQEGLPGSSAQVLSFPPGSDSGSNHRLRKQADGPGPVDAHSGQQNGGRPRYVLEFGGICKGNKGAAGAASVLSDPNGVKMRYITEGLAFATCNHAEYRGLIAGLQEAIQTGVRCVHVRGSSLTVLKQCSGEYKVKSKDLQPLHDYALELLMSLESFTLELIPKDCNMLVCKLAKAAMALPDRQRHVSDPWLDPAIHENLDDGMNAP